MGTFISKEEQTCFDIFNMLTNEWIKLYLNEYSSYQDACLGKMKPPITEETHIIMGRPLMQI